jgi:hypothetical protein
MNAQHKTVKSKTFFVLLKQAESLIMRTTCIEIFLSFVVMKWK